MFLPVLLILIGVAIGYLLPSKKKIERLSSWIVTALIFMLIFVMGMKIGVDKGIMEQLPQFGYLAAALSVAWILGCSLLGWGAWLLIRKKRGR